MKMIKEIDVIKYLGIPYKHGGGDSDGINCYGLIKLFYAQEFGIELLIIDMMKIGIKKDLIISRKNTGYNGRKLRSQKHIALLDFAYQAILSNIILELFCLILIIFYTVR